MLRQTLVSLSVALGLAAGPLHAQEQFPSKPIRFVTGAAGPSEAILRYASQKLKDRAGWTAIVEQRPGDAFLPSILALKNSPADGYTILQGFLTFVIVQVTKKDLPWDLNKDLMPLARHGYTPNMLAIPASMPQRTLAEFIAYSKANPGKVSLGATGLGTTTQMGAELLRLSLGLNYVLVPYKNGTAYTIDLMEGRLQAGISSPGAFGEQIKAGKLRALVMMAPQRAPSLPEVPTSMEVTGQDLDGSSWYGLFLRTGTPAPIAERLEKELLPIFDSAEGREAMVKLAIDPIQVMEGREAFRRKLEADVQRWSRVVKESGLKYD